MAKPRMMFYHDGRHPLIYMYEPPMQKEEYEQAVDELVGTPIEAIMFCLGDGRTVLHDTEVGELWGAPNEQWSHLIFRRAHQNAKHLIEAGNDPLRIVCERAHAKGFLLYPTLLVQQGSGERGEDTRCSNFRFDNKHLEIGARGDLDPTTPGFDCLDFKHEEVRQERFALIEETLENYAVDGFELQMYYTPHYFHPDEVEAGCAIMTDWIGRVYAAVKKSGAQRELVVRVPNSLENCLSAGLDLRAWIDQGIIDVVVAEDRIDGASFAQSADFRPLVEAVQGSQCRLQAVLNSHVDSDRLSEAPIEMVRATATNYWSQGIDGLYLAQWFSNWPYQDSFYGKMRELADPEIMAAKDKYYFVPTLAVRSANPAEQVAQRLPHKLEVDKPVTVQFSISDDLPRWAAVGRVHEVLLRARVMETTELDRLSFKLNGVELPEALMRKINRMYMMNSPRARVTGYWFIFRLDADHWPQCGANEFAVMLQHRDPLALPEIALRDVELEIKYLMGKNFHRSFVDADLGAFDVMVE
jgi:hypothetical protein